MVYLEDYYSSKMDLEVVLHVVMEYWMLERVVMMEILIQVMDVLENVLLK